MTVSVKVYRLVMKYFGKGQSAALVGKLTSIPIDLVAEIWSGNLKACYDDNAFKGYSCRMPTKKTPGVSKCPTCGGHVRMPCWMCEVKDLKAEENARKRLVKSGNYIPPPDEEETD